MNPILLPPVLLCCLGDDLEVLESVELVERTNDDNRMIDEGEMPCCNDEMQ